MKEYFNIKEVVCPHVLDRFGEEAWRFIDPHLQEVMLYLRRRFDVPVIINDYEAGLTQRGLRCNLCSLVKAKSDVGLVYLSAHVLGKAFDFDVQGMSAAGARSCIFDYDKELPYPVRLEVGVEWVHLDIMNVSDYYVEYFLG